MLLLHLRGKGNADFDFWLTCTCIDCDFWLTYTAIDFDFWLTYAVPVHNQYITRLSTYQYTSSKIIETVADPMMLLCRLWLLCLAAAAVVEAMECDQPAAAEGACMHAQTSRA